MHKIQQLLAKTKFLATPHQVYSSTYLNSITLSSVIICANTMTQNILNALAATSFDKVKIEFSYYQALAKETASDWLNTLLITLRSQIGEKIITLIIPPTFFIKMPLLQQPKINSIAEFFVLKYYDTNQPDFYICQSLLKLSSKYIGTAFGELVSNKQIWIDSCKTLISKPVSANLNQTSGGFMDSATLRSAFRQVNSDTKWFDDFANMANKVILHQIFSKQSSRTTKALAMQKQHVLLQMIFTIFFVQKLLIRFFSELINTVRIDTYYFFKWAD